MRDRILLEVDRDWVIDPFSLSYLFNPLFASDGRRYEALELRKHFDKNGNISPFTRQPITSVIYDVSLKNTLDLKFTNNHKDRYDASEYDIPGNSLSECLRALSEHITQTQVVHKTDWRESMSLSIFFGCLIFAGLYLLEMSIYPYAEINHEANLIAVGILVAIDFCIRQITGQDKNAFSLVLEQSAQPFRFFARSTAPYLDALADETLDQTLNYQH